MTKDVNLTGAEHEAAIVEKMKEVNERLKYRVRLLEEANKKANENVRTHDVSENKQI